MRALIVRDLDGNLVLELREDGEILGNEESAQEVLESTEGADDILEAALSLFANSSVLIARIESAVELSDYAVRLFNPYHDELGRFATSERSVTGAALRDVKNIRAGEGKINLTDKEVENVKGRVGEIHSSMRDETRGKFSLDVVVTHSMGEFIEKGKAPKAMAPYVLGIAHDKGQLYINPALTEALAGREKPYFKWGWFGPVFVSSADLQKVAQSTVVHETLHSRSRNHPIPYEPNGVSVRRGSYLLNIEEGCTELLTNVFMHRTGRMSASDIGRVGSYQPYVYAMATEARARYPSSPTDALGWIAKVHQNGLTPFGANETFGTRFKARNLPVSSQNFGLIAGRSRDLGWILQGADSSVKLEEENMTSVISLLMEGKIDEALDAFEENPTPSAMREISEFAMKYGDEDAREKIAARLREIGEPHPDQGDVD